MAWQIPESELWMITTLVDVEAEEHDALMQLVFSCIELHKPVKCDGLTKGLACSECKLRYGTYSYGERLRWKMNAYSVLAEKPIDTGFDPSEIT